MTDHRLRVRGIYATALTERLAEVGQVVQATPPIRSRFETSFPTAEHDVVVETTDDRLGVGVHGDPPGVETVADSLAGIAIDAFRWVDEAPDGAVFLAEVVETLGRGAVVDLGPREAFLPYESVDEYVDDGDRCRVQVHEPAPPWADHRPEVGGTFQVRGGLVTLVRGLEGPSADVPDPERASELVRTTELIPTDPPAGWGIRWERAAADADVDALNRALEAAIERVDALEAHLDGGDPPATTTWIQFGRGSRFSLDAVRRRVTPTMHGHHRIKAGGDAASAAVDLVERLCVGDGDGDGDGDGSAAVAAAATATAENATADAPNGDQDSPARPASRSIDDFPFEAVADTFGPDVGDRYRILHGKPDGRRFPLGRGEVTDRTGDTVTVRRTLAAGGEYDALGVPKEGGDVAITKLVEGRWWYPTVYRRADGETKGTYVNVCTPVELFPDAASYVDLHVDVVRHPDGTVERVDDEELDDAVEAGLVTDDLATKAREVATAVERALS